MPDTSLAPALPGPFTPPGFTPPERDLPLLAAVRAFRTNALATWPRRAYEEMVIVRPFLGRRSVLVNEPAAIRALLVEGGERFGRSAATIRLLEPMVGHGLFLSEGAAWRHQRRTLAPAFTPRAIGLLVPGMRQAIEESLGRLAQAVRSGRPLDLLSFCQTLALEVAGRAMFSLGMRRYAGPLRALIYRYGRSGAPRFLDLLLPADVITPHDVVRRSYGRRWMALVERMLAARRREGARAPSDLLRMIEAARDPETGEGFGPEEIRDQMATMVLAGHETTALTIFWSLTLLAQSPAWQARLAAEAAAGTEDAAALPLARAVVEEALRLYPPAFAIVRVAKGPERLAGVALRARDAAMVAPWVLHRHRRLWEAPDAFDPRRFLPPAPPPERFAYLPFGAGPRGLHRRPIRIGGSDARPGDGGGALSPGTGDRPAGAAGGRRHHRAGPCAALSGGAAIVSPRSVPRRRGIGSRLGRDARKRAGQAQSSRRARRIGGVSAVFAASWRQEAAQGRFDHGAKGRDCSMTVPERCDAWAAQSQQSFDHRGGHA